MILNIPLTSSIHYKHLIVSERRHLPSLLNIIYRVQIKMPVILCAADRSNCAGMQGGKLFICSLIERKM